MRWRLALFGIAVAPACWLCGAEQDHKGGDIGRVVATMDANILSGSASDYNFLAAAADLIGKWHPEISQSVLVSYKNAFGEALPGIRNQLESKGCMSIPPCSAQKVNAGIVQIWSDLLLVSREEKQITPIMIQDRVGGSGYVQIWSEPDNATFEFKETNGVWKDITDKEAYKEIGKHRLKITKAGFQDWEDDCNVPSSGGVACGTKLKPKAP